MQEVLEQVQVHEEQTLQSQVFSPLLVEAQTIQVVQVAAVTPMVGRLLDQPTYQELLGKEVLEVEPSTQTTLLAVNFLKEFGTLVEVVEEKPLLVLMLLL